MNDLRTAIRAFVEERDWEQFHSPKNLAMALRVEVAELIEHFQWLTEEESNWQISLGSTRWRPQRRRWRSTVRSTLRIWSKGTLPSTRSIDNDPDIRLHRWQP
jgi:hypothetical protein